MSLSIIFGPKIVEFMLTLKCSHTGFILIHWLNYLRWYFFRKSSVFADSLISTNFNQLKFGVFSFTQFVFEMWSQIDVSLVLFLSIGKIPVRLNIGLMLFASCFVSYMLRVNMSINILAMVHHSEVEVHDDHNVTAIVEPDVSN